MRSPMPLPDGYRVEEARGHLRLFDPTGRLLREAPRGPGAAAALEAGAWDDAWGRVEAELREELAAFRAGTRSLHELRRLRQYLRLLDAVSRPAHEATPRPRRREAVSWLALAAAVAALVIVVATLPWRVAKGPASPGPTARPAASEPAARRPVPLHPAGTGRLAAPSPAPRRAVQAPARPPAPPMAEGVRGRWPSVAGYAVSVGEFTNQAAAELRMHFVRSKGYLVYVMPAGTTFHVVTRPYPRRDQAERLAGALQEIGLPARTQSLVPPAL